MPIAALFAVITLALAAVALWAGASGQWLIAACSAVLSLWMASLAWTALRKIRS